jgi:hypothetical protein
MSHHPSLGYNRSDMKRCRLSVSWHVILKTTAPLLAFWLALIGQACSAGSPAPSPAAAPAKPAAAQSAAQPADSGDALRSMVAEELTKRRPGQIVFNPPTDMTVGEPELVEVRIAENLKQDITSGLEGRGVPKVESIPVSTYMRTTLHGDGFTINRLTPEEQAVAGDTVARWSWNVVPIKSGNQMLQLAVCARVVVPGTVDTAQCESVMERRINVRVNAAKYMTDFLSVLSNNLQWIVTALLLPLAVHVWRTVKNKSGNSG